MELAQAYAASYDVEVYKGGDTSGNTVNRVVNENTDRIKYVLENLDPTAGPVRLAGPSPRRQEPPR